MGFANFQLFWGVCLILLIYSGGKQWIQLVQVYIARKIESISPWGHKKSVRPPPLIQGRLSQGRPFVFLFESPSFLNIISCVVKKRNEYVILGDGGIWEGGGGEWSRILFHRKINATFLISWTTFSHPLFGHYKRFLSV